MSWFKRRYLDVRNGMITVSPVIAISNFVLIAYNFTELKDMISIEYFSVLFIVIFLISMGVIGHMFRQVQISTDIKLNYEKNTEHAKTMCALLAAIDEINPSDSLKERIKYHESILKKTV